MTPNVDTTWTAFHPNLDWKLFKERRKIERIHGTSNP